MNGLARTLMIAGLVLVALGLLLQWGPSIPFLGRLPGDLRIERPGLRLYLPLASCLVVSLLVSALLTLLSRFR